MSLQWLEDVNIFVFWTRTSQVCSPVSGRRFVSESPFPKLDDGESREPARGQSSFCGASQQPRRKRVIVPSEVASTAVTRNLGRDLLISAAISLAISASGADGAVQVIPRPLLMTKIAFKNESRKSATFASRGKTTSHSFQKKKGYIRSNAT